MAAAAPEATAALQATVRQVIADLAVHRAAALIAGARADRPAMEVVRTMVVVAAATAAVRAAFRTMAVAQATAAAEAGIAAVRIARRATAAAEAGTAAVRITRRATAAAIPLGDIPTEEEAVAIRAEAALPVAAAIRVGEAIPAGAATQAAALQVVTTRKLRLILSFDKVWVGLRVS